jgi:cell fate (sporulation/competence/biofilm development) regulator YlbF (YheA/YmcA/DUF963 family)
MNIIEKIDCIKTNSDKSVYVRTSINKFEDGILIDFKFKQKNVNPGDDYSAQDAEVQAICSAVHTPEVVEAYQAAQEALKAAQLPQG